MVGTDKGKFLQFLQGRLLFGEIHEFGGFAGLKGFPDRDLYFPDHVPRRLLGHLGKTGRRIVLHLFHGLLKLAQHSFEVERGELVGHDFENDDGDDEDTQHYDEEPFRETHCAPPFRSFSAYSTA